MDLKKSVFSLGLSSVCCKVGAEAPDVGGNFEEMSGIWTCFGWLYSVTQTLSTFRARLIYSERKTSTVTLASDYVQFLYKAFLLSPVTLLPHNLFPDAVTCLED